MRINRKNADGYDRGRLNKRWIGKDKLEKKIAKFFKM